MARFEAVGRPRERKTPGNPAGGGRPDPRPRVLFFLLRPDEHIYGGTRSILLFLEEQRAVDPYVVVGAASANDPVVGELRRLGIAHEVVVLPELLLSFRRKSPAQKVLKFGYLAVTNVRLARLIGRIDPDAVHTDREAVFLIGPAAKAAGRKLIQHLRDVPGNQRVGWSVQLGLVLADRSVAIAPSLRQFYEEGSWSPLRSGIARKLVCIYNGFRLEQPERAHNGHSREAARAELGIEPGSIAIGVVGGIFPAKGQLEFLEGVAPTVCEADARVRLYFVGGVKDHEYHRRCEEVVQRRGLEGRVVFAGFQHDMAGWYRALDLLAFPSIREGFGRVVVEAQASGVPVVASDIVGVRDAVEHGVGGYLARDAAEFSGYLLRLIDDAALRESRGSDGRAFASRFDVGAVSRDLERLYGELVGDGGPTAHSADS